MTRLVVRDEFPGPHHRPTEKQNEFWDACADPGADEILFSGSIRGGKTQAAAKQLVSWAWTYGGTYVVLRKTYRELADSTQKAILRGDGPMPPALPPELVQVYRAKDEMVVLKNGAEILFRSAEDPKATEDKMKNVTMAGFLIDQIEELDSDDYFTMYKTLLGRLSDPRGPRKALLVANPSAETHWVYVRFVDPATRKPWTRCVHVTLYDNAHNLHPRYVENLERRKVEDPDWFERYALGKWGAFGGKRFKVWDPQLHVCEPVRIDPGWEIIEGIDYGWDNPTAVVWVAIDYEGRWYVVAEHRESQRPISWHATEMKKIRAQLNISPSSIWLDPSAWAERNQYESPAMEFFDYGIHCARAQNDRLGGWNRIEELLSERMDSDDLPRLRIFNTCHRLIKELPSLKIKDGTDDVEKKDDHLCLVGGTLVETDGGPVAIERLRLGDRVLTRGGYRPVEAVALTRRQAPVLRARFSDGSELVGTANHPVWVVAEGFRPMDSLRYGDECVAALSNPTRTVRRDSCGAPTTAPSRQGTTSTTSTVTPLTTASTTCNASRAQTTASFTPVPTAHSATSPASAPQSGTAPRRGWRGTATMGGPLGPRGSRWSASARSAARRTRPSSHPARASAAAPAKPAPFVLGVEPHGTADVYDITVAGEHEFFANGLLVANSDALRYVVMSRTPTPLRPEEEEVDRNELYARNLLARFRDRQHQVYTGG